MLDSLTASEEIRRRVVDLVCERAFVRDVQLAALLRDQWAGAPEQGGLVGDLWVEPTYFAEPSEQSLQTLADAGEIHPRLRDLLARNLGGGFVGRPLYKHQLESIRLAKPIEGARPALVVAAPTGSGKTESFLLPTLDLLLREPRRGVGMRCLILYPMNALVNDQVERLDRWLGGQTDVRLFQFTSETPEDLEAAKKRGIDTNATHRIATRQQARGQEPIIGASLAHAPDVVVTNYSMLEYMLSRPLDARFFGPALEAVVLDEAHLYTGTLALEIQLLLRRVLERCRLRPEQVLFTASSATLGADAAILGDFFARLTSKDRRLVRVVEGRPVDGRVLLSEPRPPAGLASATALASFVGRMPRTLREDGEALLQSPSDCDVGLIRFGGHLP